MSAVFFDADRLIRLRRVSAVAPSPCGTWLAAALARPSQDESAYVSDLWRVSLDPSQPPVRLTWGDDSDTGPRFRADGALAFLRTRRADGAPRIGRTQVWLMPAVGGEPRPITDEPLGVRDFRLAGERLFLIADVLPGVPREEQRARAEEQARRGPSGLRYTAMPVRHWDHWLPVATPHVVLLDRDPAAGERRRDLTPDAAGEYQESDVGVISWDVAVDGRRVAITAQHMGPDQCPDSALRLIDADSGESVDLGLLDGAGYTMPRFAPHGRQLACVRGFRQPGQAETQTLWTFDVPDEMSADPTPGARQGRALAAGWDVWPALHTWTPDGAAVIATADVHGHVPVFRVDVATGEVTRLTAEAAGGSHGSLHVVAGAAGQGHGGASLVGIRHRLVHPPEPFRVDLCAGAEPVLLAELSGFTAAEGEAIASWESFATPGDGGAAVQSFLLQPRGKAGPHPALVWIHGGPVNHHADGWHWRWNALIPVAAGYAVVLPNPRGSTGFGQEFIAGVFDNDWGGACYRDLTAVTDAVCARSDIDERRLGAMGGSFGGYMANWIGGNTDRFRCLMTHAGVFHMSSFSGVTDYPGYFRYMLACSPYEDAEAFDHQSPHRLVGQWKTPTLIIHGEKDYRVPISEALMVFTALQSRGIESELLVFPDENHWITRPRNIRQWYDTVLAFADRHLRDA